MADAQILITNLETKNTNLLLCSNVVISCDTLFKASDMSLILAAKEATSAYHAAIHGQSFENSDCTSKLVLKYLNLNLPLQEQNVNQ